MRPNHFDEDVARYYDEDPRFDPSDVDPTVDVLADLAGDGRALEFAVGTGRIALPLSRRGVPVDGIEYSAAMAARLRAKPGSERVNVTLGDMASTHLGRTYRLVYLVYNTIGNLTTQADQVDCFRNAAAHLEPGGVFVIEVGVPRIQGLPFGETSRPFDVSADHVGIDTYDVVSQGLVSTHFSRTTDGSFRKGVTPVRYVWPSELDLMAALAGLSPEARWADWDRSPFTATSEKHVSLWRKA